MTSKNRLFIFGPGYSGQAVARKAISNGWKVFGTARSEEKAERLKEVGISPVIFGSKAMAEAAGESPNWLVSIAPKAEGDPALEEVAKHQVNGPRWLGYLSSTNVYGDHGGNWVDEATPTRPSLERGIRRVGAESAWQAFANETEARCHIFRLAGIYGPGRNAVRSLLDGKAKRIVKQGQLFSRIHVEDIAEAIWLAMTGDHKSSIFNLADDRPCPPQQVIADAAAMLGVAAPPEVPFEEADLSPMARSFYMESKRVRNDLVKKTLGMKFRYPDYKAALPKFVKNEQPL
ncbi:MAG: SDR family oxidoreductase [Alphaproteobacteria bacterium]|nr:SDR family oxidoreductase [Alphaproteobacteria bacterium]